MLCAVECDNSMVVVPIALYEDVDFEKLLYGTIGFDYDCEGHGRVYV